MINNLNDLLSSNILNMKRSVIRELLKLTQKPEIISFAGGLPSPQSFPVDMIKEITCEVLDKKGAKALQYGSTEGIPEMVDALKELMKETEGIELKNENIIPTTASQQGLDIVGKIFIDKGDTVIVESPTYVGAIGAFNSYQANMVDVEMDFEGMRMDKLEETLEDLKKKSIKPKFIYVIPDFHNPAGVTMPLERRKKLLEIAERENIVIIEDSPYRMIRYRGETIPSLYKLDGGKRVVSLFTFSKILVPGFRLGWAIGPEEIIDKFVVAKQAKDLCTPPFNQYITAEFLKRGLLSETVKKTIEIYREKNELMLQLLDEKMPKDKGVKWTKPEGGLFLWVTMPDNIDCDEMFKKAIEENVAYVVGSAFYVGGRKKNSFRLNFSYPSKEDIRKGVDRLVKVVNETLG
ncbi:MAG: PLP-dependent aminotransferase family protein [candidate division WOR-3 bacterium]|nr:PLP-dependent aminotransferase family protein [candidate division WOR-3 bacterium]